MSYRWIAMLVVVGMLLAPTRGSAQTLGVFAWQLQPFCNVVRLTVTQSGNVFRLEGVDDQCGVGPSSAIGTASVGQGGAVGLGLTIVTAPLGEPIHVNAIINLATLGGTWQDSAGNNGAFVFTPGAGTGGPARARTAPLVPATIVLSPDGALEASGTFGSGTFPVDGPGTRMTWYPSRAAFRAGQVTGVAWDRSRVGSRSTAFGFNTIASGASSTAMGTETNAAANSSTALGNATNATGSSSVAMGTSTVASGANSVAVGQQTEASGVFSLATGDRAKAIGAGAFTAGSQTIASGDSAVAVGTLTVASALSAFAAGTRTTASGQESTALGDRTVASAEAALASGIESTASGVASFAAGAAVSAGGTTAVALGTLVSASTNGTFMFGDRSTLATNTPMLTFVPNQFLVRAAGGTSFYSNAALTTGVILLPGANAWSSASDVRLKHHFRELDGDEVLAKLARLSIQEWSYKAQDAAIRHIGPTAQEFYDAFGLGEDALRISTLDADGVALRAVQALEARERSTTATASIEIEDLRARIATLERQLVAALAALAERPR